MAVITFQNKEGWRVAKWAYYKLFDDIRERYPLTHDLDYELEQAKVLDGMHFRLTTPDMRLRIMRMIKETISDIVADEENQFQGSLDMEGYQMYKKRLPELLDLINKYENAEWVTEEE